MLLDRLISCNSELWKWKCSGKVRRYVRNGLVIFAAFVISSRGVRDSWEFYFIFFEGNFLVRSFLDTCFLSICIVYHEFPYLRFIHDRKFMVETGKKCLFVCKLTQEALFCKFCKKIQRALSFGLVRLGENLWLNQSVVCLISLELIQRVRNLKLAEVEEVQMAESRKDSMEHRSPLDNYPPKPRNDSDDITGGIGSPGRSNANDDKSSPPSGTGGSSGRESASRRSLKRGRVAGFGRGGKRSKQESIGK